MKRLVACLLLVAFSSSCAVGPKYRRPQVEVPEKFRGEEGVAESAITSFAELPWWEVFQDEELQALIRIALEQNKDIKLAAARVEEARGLYRQKHGEQFPELNFLASGSQTFTSNRQLDDEGNIGIINRTFAAVGVDLSYQADLWGRYRRGSEAARADLFAREEFRRTVILTLLSDVARAYFELRALDLEREISLQTAGVRRHSLGLTRIRLKGGIVSLLDVRQSEAELAFTTANIARFEQAIALKENQISLLLGQNPQPIPRGKSLTKQSIPPSIPIDLPSQLLERRPDIREAEQQLIASNARIGEAKSLFFPQVNLGTIAGMAAVSGPVGGITAIASLGGQLLQSLFDGGKRKGNLQAAKARFEQALIQYQKVIQQSLREVSDGLISIKKLGEIRKEQEKLLVAARDTNRLSSARYEGGVTSYLEVLESERIFYRSQLELVQIQKDQLVAIVQLYRALGGGWSAIAPETQISKLSPPLKKGD